MESTPTAALRTNSGRPVRFYGSQVGAETPAPLSYTGSPVQLLRRDVKLFFRWLFLLPFIVVPLTTWRSGELDELYPSWGNLYVIALHVIAIITQSAFLLSLPFVCYLAFPLVFFYVVGFCLLNVQFCKLLNDNVPSRGLKSYVDPKWKPHPNEEWIFLNGVAVGRHWLQSDIDRIARSFHRPVTGVHNQTSGIIFDVIQCLIQRCLTYATGDIRDCYVLVKDALYRQNVNKVVFICHSQGAIEGSMILDWLLNEVPQNLLSQLEVYTFGNAANHFNNPYRDEHSSISASTPKLTESSASGARPLHRAIAHIEHYANDQDFVARWGVLNFVRPEVKPANHFENRFMGRVFERHGTGHQMNQHYLDWMFPLDPTCSFIREIQDGDFMDSNLTIVNGSDCREGPLQSLQATRGVPLSLNIGHHHKQIGNGAAAAEAIEADEAESEEDEVLLRNFSPTVTFNEKIKGIQSTRLPFSRGVQNGTSNGVKGSGGNSSSNNAAAATNGKSSGTSNRVSNGESSSAGGQESPGRVMLKVKDLSRLWAYRNGMEPPPTMDSWR